MSTPQSGILPPANSSGIFLCVDFIGAAKACSFFNHVLSCTKTLSKNYAEAQLTSVLGVGADAWRNVFNKAAPVELKGFPEIKGKESIAPSSPFDVFIHIRSNRPDISFELAKQCVMPFQKNINIVEEINGFKYMDNRDLIGFVDGTENPEGDHRAQVALVGEGEYQGGSYIHIQRYEHDLQKWKSLALKKTRGYYRKNQTGKSGIRKKRQTRFFSH